MTEGNTGVLSAPTATAGRAAAGGVGAHSRTDERLQGLRAIRHVVVLALLTVAIVATLLLVSAHGWSYYATPLRVRGYQPSHHLLRPSGVIGQWLGIGGTVLMLVMQLYSVRKRFPRAVRVGSVPAWLEFHIYCGIVGPALITFHTSFKFNGIVSVAYWSMILVMLSGFVGRYLYVRIPRSIRGQELTLDELEAEAAQLRQELLDASLPVELLMRVEAFEERACRPPEKGTSVLGLVGGDLALRFRLRALERDLRRAGFPEGPLANVLNLIRERAVLLRRIAYLRRTRKLFDLWHVFHRPFAYVMLVIVTIHVATAIYFGYAFSR